MLFVLASGGLQLMQSDTANAATQHNRRRESRCDVNTLRSSDSINRVRKDRRGTHRGRGNHRVNRSPRSRLLKSKTCPVALYSSHRHAPEHPPLSWHSQFVTSAHMLPPGPHQVFAHSSVCACRGLLLTSTATPTPAIILRPVKATSFSLRIGTSSFG